MVRDFGCQSILEFCVVLTDIFTIEVPSTKSQSHVLYPYCKKDISQEILDLTIKSDTKIPEEILTKIQSVMLKHPKGIDVKMFLYAYEVRIFTLFLGD